MQLELTELKIIEVALHGELSRAIDNSYYNEVLALYAKVWKRRQYVESEIEKAKEWVNKFKED